ncbi:MAG TPA: sarcinarray family MAST domain-containing protein, partial [Methanocella sp.]|nr:sarcinarray family MAST domain-containing protein [Methanocella sp.]
VSNISLSPGEPFSVDLYITPDGDAATYAELDEPGTPRAYDRVGGDELMPKAGIYCNASQAAHYHWAMVVSDRWTKGTAPLNIYYQLNRPGSDFMIASGYFTVVDAYIAPGKATVAGCGDVQGSATPTPGPGALSVLIALAVALFYSRTHGQKVYSFMHLIELKQRPREPQPSITKGRKGLMYLDHKRLGTSTRWR